MLSLIPPKEIARWFWYQLSWNIENPFYMPISIEGIFLSLKSWITRLLDQKIYLRLSYRHIFQKKVEEAKQSQ